MRVEPCGCIKLQRLMNLYEKVSMHAYFYIKEYSRRYCMYARKSKIDSKIVSMPCSIPKYYMGLTVLVVQESL